MLFLLIVLCCRWIQPDRTYRIAKYDSSLPQMDPCEGKRIVDSSPKLRMRKINSARRQELEERRQEYRFMPRGHGRLPKKIEKCPPEENFSHDYKVVCLWLLIVTNINIQAYFEKSNNNSSGFSKLLRMSEPCYTYCTYSTFHSNQSYIEQDSS